MKDNGNRSDRIEIHFESKNKTSLLHERGNRKDAAMSQDAITKEFELLEQKIDRVLEIINSK